MANRYGMILVNGQLQEMSSSDTILGNISGSAATVTGAAQTAITSVGTLDSLTIKAGTGAATIKPVGLISINLTPVANVGTGEDDLMSYTLPLNSLSAAGKGIRVTAWGAYPNNANTKTINMYFGGTQVNTSTMLTNAAGVWQSEMLFFSTGTDTQRYVTNIARISSTAVDVPFRTLGTLAKDDGADIIIKYTGTATADNDIIQSGMLIEFLN